jgi:GDPmannose 4,6-dehydratase
MTDKIAFITGINGMDGSYLTELLIEKGYIVHGIVRRASSINTCRIDNLFQDINIKDKKLILHYGDMTDSSNISSLIKLIKPDEVYNLAAMSHVKVSFEVPEYTGDVDGIGTLRVLEAIRALDKPCKFYQAGTSELYGGVYNEPQNEKTPFYPRSPYAVAKLYAFWITKNYRESYNMFAVNGILFNHTSPRRGETFVEQKIVKAAVAIKQKRQKCLYLGNIYSYRDIGHSKDFVKAMWMMLQKDKPNDYVIASGKTYQIKEIVNFVFNYLKMPLVWYGEGNDEYACINTESENNVEKIVKINPKYFRPSEVHSLHGDCSKAKEELGWSPNYNLDNILIEMIEEEIKKQVKN